MAELGAAELGQMTEGMSDSEKMIFQSQYGAVRKDRGTGLLLSVLGWDRFWLGQTGLGILKYITGGGCLVWWLVDIFTAGSRCDDYNRQKAQEIAAAMRASGSSQSEWPAGWARRKGWSLPEKQRKEREEQSGSDEEFENLTMTKRTMSNIYRHYHRKEQ